MQTYRRVSDTKLRLNVRTTLLAKWILIRIIRATHKSSFSRKMWRIKKFGRQVKSVNSRGRRLGLNSSSDIYQLCESGRVHRLLCALLSLHKMDHRTHLRVMKTLNGLLNIQCPEHRLNACSFDDNFCLNQEAPFLEKKAENWTPLWSHVLQSSMLDSLGLPLLFLALCLRDSPATRVSLT